MMETANSRDEPNKNPPRVTAQTLEDDIRTPGLEPVQAISSCMTRRDRVQIFVGVFIIAFAYLLDYSLRLSYQPAAVATFGVHSLQGTLNVIRSVVSTAAQPTSAKIADIFGRVELICASVLFYTVGTIVEATAPSFRTMAVGGILYQVGYTMIILLIEVIVADITTTRARLFFTYVSAMPFIISTWISGTISSAVLDRNRKLGRWRWGVGMFAIIYAVAALPLICSLLAVSRRAEREGKLAGRRSPFSALGARDFATKLFWYADVIGVALVIIIFGFILAPLTLAGGIHSEWSRPKIIVPLLIGVLTIPVFIAWERKAPYPIMPFEYMTDRGVWAPIGITIFYNLTYSLQADYLYTVLQVVFGFNVQTATTLTSLYSFTSVVVGPLFALLVYRVRRLKVFVVVGTILYMAAFGLIYSQRCTEAGTRAGVIGGQVLLGVAGGLFPYPSQTALQISVKHEHLAMMMGLFLAISNIGFGSAISGAIWSQILPVQLHNRLSPINATLPHLVYADPFAYLDTYPMGTPERQAIILSYQAVQRLFLITGMATCVGLIFFGLALRNQTLDNSQTLKTDLGESSLD